jgi:hypothetical protein
MWYELLIFGGWIFWLYVTLATALFLICAEHDDKSVPTIAVMVLFLTIWFFFGDLWQLIVEDPWQCIDWSVAWLGVGALWSFPRWIILLHRARTEYKASFKLWSEDENEHKMHWFASYGFRSLASEYGLDTTYEYGVLVLVPPTFEHNQSRLVNWILLWPWSMAWTLIRDGFYRLLDAFSGLYQRISAWMFKGL